MMRIKFYTINCNCMQCKIDILNENRLKILMTVLSVCQFIDEVGGDANND